MLGSIVAQQSRMGLQSRLWAVSFWFAALAGCGDPGPDCSANPAGGKLTFHLLGAGSEGCPELGPLDRVPPATECTEGCTCTLGAFEAHEEEADWFGGSSSYDCRSRFEQTCATDGTQLTCNLIVGNTKQASAICRLTSEHMGPNWFCDYQATLDFE